MQMIDAIIKNRDKVIELQSKLNLYEYIATRRAEEIFSLRHNISKKKGSLSSVWCDNCPAHINNRCPSFTDMIEDEFNGVVSQEYCDYYVRRCLNEQFKFLDSCGITLSSPPPIIDFFEHLFSKSFLSKLNPNLSFSENGLDPDYWHTYVKRSYSLRLDLEVFTTKTMKEIAKTMITEWNKKNLRACDDN